ncbi:hypothetical protein LRS10_22415 [Phenylobacterium sp. J426]|uniref:hypothetical protein n=1 Tax=Phenylobacterium sp. J426 TaxID=2898439 RepID=UPI0021508C1C|nr:hypothetical protein [Phenylobacterium sp. J426]MCR5876663.1 hypothetical protein [Phenylobacterium sp. J426]
MRLLVCGRLAAAAVSLLACSAAARPVTVDDVLAREAVGRVALGARWAVLELRGPYESGAAFDYDLRNDILRTGLHAVDLRQPAAPRPLFQADGATAKAGYAMGPLSPDGERLAVFRLSDGEWRLGVADIAAAQVTWLDLTPELNPTGETVQWLGDHALVVLTAPEGLLPLDLRLRRYTPLLADRRRINAHGGVSATVLGSGRYLDQTPQDPPGRMVRVDLATGAVRTLAVGRFTDLEISASGRWIAAFSAGPLIPLRSDQPVQGPHGTETRRTRLSLVDARTGAIRPIARDHDMLPQLLRWAPAADELLVLGRADGHPWSAGRLLRVEASTSAVQPLLAVRPHVSGRPAAVRAGWLSGRPVVFGTAASAPQDARPEWFRLERDRAIGLTASLPSPAPSEPSVLTDAALWLPAGDGAWRIGRDDAPRLISAPGARLAIPLVQGLRRRREQFPLEAAEPPPWLARAPDAKLLAAGPHGLVVSRWRPRWGGGDRLAISRRRRHAAPDAQSWAR